MDHDDKYCLCDMCKNKLEFIDGKECEMKVKVGDKITLEYNEEENENIITTESNLDICYEDEHILILNKPDSLAVQPSHKHYEENIVHRGFLCLYTVCCSRCCDSAKRKFAGKNCCSGTGTPFKTCNG